MITPQGYNTCMSAVRRALPLITRGSSNTSPNPCENAPSNLSVDGLTAASGGIRFVQRGRISGKSQVHLTADVVDHWSVTQRPWFVVSPHLARERRAGAMCALRRKIECKIEVRRDEVIEAAHLTRNIDGESVDVYHRSDAQHCEYVGHHAIFVESACLCPFLGKYGVSRLAENGCIPSATDHPTEMAGTRSICNVVPTFYAIYCGNELRTPKRHWR